MYEIHTQIKRKWEQIIQQPCGSGKKKIRGNTLALVAKVEF